MSDSLIGQTIDGYRIEDVLGRGGMGTVYRAVDVALDKPVALKVMAPRLADDETFLERFRSEARALARLDAPGIVRVLALRETDAGVFIVMEYVEGDTLDTLLQRHAPIDWDRALPLFRQILEAVSHAHASGVLHRDLKPGNILITDDGQVKITDFGLAKIQATDADLTSTFETAGTIYYMSPEQIKGLRHVDARSDLFALGMIFYEVLTGRLPVETTASNYAIQHAIVEEPLLPPVTFQPDLPPALNDVLMTMLAKDPADRFQDARAVLEALQPLEERAGQSPSAAPAFASPSASATNWTRWGAGLALGVAALVLLGGAFWTVQALLRPPSSQPATPPPPESVSLAIDTTPSGAVVFIGGDSVGLAPVQHRVPPGSVAIRARLDGAEALDTVLTVTGNRQLALDLPRPLTASGEALDDGPPPSETSTPASGPPAEPPPSTQTPPPTSEPSDEPASDPVAQPQTGTLTITSTPNRASVLLDGAAIGTTPLTLDSVPTGTHQVQLQKGGYELYTTTVQIRPEATERIQAPLQQQTAVLSVRVIPFGDVLIDGSLRAELAEQAVSDTLAPGTYEISAQYQDNQWVRTVTLAPGASERITIDFTQTVTLPITARTATGAPIPNAEIRVDGTVRGYTPQQLQLRVGQHTIRIQKDGYIPAQRTINVEPDQTHTLRFELRPSS